MNSAPQESIADSPPPPPPVPNLYEMKVAWALLRLCIGDVRFVHYLPHEQAEVIRFFRYVDPEPNGQDVERAQSLLEGWEAT